MHICFTLADSMVHMRKVNSYVSYDKNNDRLQRVIDQNFVNPIIEGYKVLAYTPDSSAVVFEMTALFTGGDAAVTPMVDEAFPLAFRNSINKSLSAIDGIKAFEDNVSIKSSLVQRECQVPEHDPLRESSRVDQSYPYIIAFAGRPDASAYLGFPYRYFLDEQTIYCK